jgi:hypothetical protein
MHQRLASLLAVLSLMSLVPAQQDILHYKFDESGGTQVVNFAPAGSPAPREGTIVSSDVTAFAPGRFGLGSLRGGGTGGTAFRSHIDTGWNGTFTGSFSVACWMLQRVAPAGTSYLFDLGNAPATQGSFRCFSGGVAGRGLYLRYWGGTPNPLILPYDLQTAASAAWVHVAIVVDDVGGAATWYINGAPHTVIPIAGTAAVTGVTQNFLVGFYPQFTGINNYDLDEFRFLNRAATAQEVMLWSLHPPAADGAFGAGCGLTLAGLGGLPTLGNLGYGLNVTGTPSAGLLVVGRSRVRLGPAPLPLDLGLWLPGLNGCLLHSSADFILVGGTGLTPFGIPQDPALAGAVVYCQAVFAGGAPGWLSSNPLAVALGY